MRGTASAGVVMGRFESSRQESPEVSMVEEGPRPPGGLKLEGLKLEGFECGGFAAGAGPNAGGFEFDRPGGGCTGLGPPEADTPEAGSVTVATFAAPPEARLN
jgi:hypothetical protein